MPIYITADVVYFLPQTIIIIGTYFIAVHTSTQDKFFPNTNCWLINEWSKFNFKYTIHVKLTFESVGEILKCGNSNESYRAVLSCGAVYYAVQGDSNF